MENKEIITNGEVMTSSWNRERGLTHMLHLNLEIGGGIGFGGYHLSGDACYKWIMKLMDVLSLETLAYEDITGKIVRVKLESKFGPAIAIGHPIKDIWMNPKELFKEGNNE